MIALAHTLNVEHSNEEDWGSKHREELTISLILRILGGLDEHAVTNIMVLGSTLEQGLVEENFGELTSDMVFDFALCGEQAEVVTAVDNGACLCLFCTVVA